eukprot:212824_1
MGLCLSYSGTQNVPDLDHNKSNLETHIDSPHNNTNSADISGQLQPETDDSSPQSNNNDDDETDAIETNSNPSISPESPLTSIKIEPSGDYNNDGRTNPSEAHVNTVRTIDPKETPTTTNTDANTAPNTIINTAHKIDDTKTETEQENEPNKASHNRKSSYHFVIAKTDTKDDTKDTYSTFVDYSKLFTKTKAKNQDTHDQLAQNIINNQITKEHGRANLIDLEQKETGIVLDQQRVAYNAWCTVQPSPTFIDQSKPKRILIDTANHHTAKDVVPITTLPALIDCGGNEQRLLLLGFIREMVSRFDFAWILPMDVIDLCYQYIPNKISSIFVIAGNMSNNYMEYHLFTAHDHEEQYNKKRMCSIDNKRMEETHTMYKYKQLQFKINDINGKEIKTLDEDFDCAHCGICYAQNITIPRAMCKNNSSELVNECAAYSAIIKCGGEVIVDDMNFCTNYCNAIMFDTNALLLPDAPDRTHATDVDKKEDDASGLKAALTAAGISWTETKPQAADLMEIDCFELKLPRLKTKCQYTSIYSEYHGLIAMGMDRKRKQSNVYQLSFKDRVDNRYDWKALSALNCNHLYGSMCMINNDENLVVLGGNDSNKMEIYDWNTQEWNALTDIHYNTNYSGVCYNFLHSNILICGGYGASCRKSGCYNIVKDQWFKLPQLQYKHRCYPTVFNHVNNPSITYCFGDNNQSFSFMEYVDLRDDQQMVWCDINKKDMYHHISPSQIRNIIV